MDVIIPTPRQYGRLENEPIIGAPVGRENQIGPEQLEPAVFNQIRRDLYLSFMVSQGQEEDQKSWLRAAAAYYRSVWSDQEISQLPAAIDRMDRTISAAGAKSSAGKSSQLPIPVKHRPSTEKARAERGVTREEQLEKHWAVFKEWIDVTEPTTEGAKQLTLPTHEVADLARRVAKSDLRYQAEDNPRTGGYPFDKDPHASLFRTHVFQGVSTGSEAFDAVFGTIRGLMAHAESPELRSQPNVEAMLDTVTQLEQAWEGIHPGSDFNGAPDVSRARRTIGLGELTISSST